MTRLQTYLKDFSILKTRERIGILILLFFAFAIGAAFSLSQRDSNPNKSFADQQPEISPSNRVKRDNHVRRGAAVEFDSTPYTAVMTPQFSSILQISVDRKIVRPFETFSVLVYVNPDSDMPDAVDLVLRFHPGRVKAVEIEPGDSYRIYPKKEIGENTITISANGPRISASSGPVELATIMMQALDQPDTVFIVPDQEKTAVVVDGKNILTAQELQDVSVRIQ